MSGSNYFIDDMPGPVTASYVSTIEPEFMKRNAQNNAQRGAANSANEKRSSNAASAKEAEQNAQKRVIEICQQGVQILGEVLVRDSQQTTNEILAIVRARTESEDAVTVLKSILRGPKSSEFVKALHYFSKGVVKDENKEKMKQGQKEREESVVAIKKSLDEINNKEGGKALQNFLYNSNDQEGVKVLRAILHVVKNEEIRNQLDDFAIFVASSLKGMSSEVRDPFMQSVLNNFEDFCSIATSVDLPIETRRLTIHNLALGLAKVCVPGMTQNIESSTREIKIYTEGISQSFIHQLTVAIDQYNLQYVPKENEALDKKAHLDKNVYEIHYLALFFNGVADHFNLPKRKDAFLEDYYLRRNSDFVEFHPGELKNFANNLVRNVTVEKVIEHMASDCLERVRAFYKKHHPGIFGKTIDPIQLDEVYKDFEKNLKVELGPFFGPLDASLIFLPCAGEHERYRVVTNDKLIAVQITKNLKKAGVIKSEAKYVLGEKGAGLKIKLRDDQFYVSETFISDGNKKHLRTSIDQFIWQNPDRCKTLLKEIEDRYKKDGFLRSVRADILVDRPESLAMEMFYIHQEFGLEEVDKLYDQAFSLLEEEDKKDDAFISELLFYVSGDKELVKHFFEKLNPESFKIESARFFEVLALAISFCLDDVVKDLIEKIPPRSKVLSMESDLHGTLVAHAICCRRIEIAEILIDKSSVEQLCIPFRLNETILHLALKHLPKLVVRLIRILPPEHLNAQEDAGYGETPLMCALRNNRLEEALLLTEKLDAQQLSVQKKDRWTPTTVKLCEETALMDAIIYKQTAAAIVMIHKHDANQLNIKRFDMETALTLALETDQPDLAELILSKLEDKHLNARVLCVALKKMYKDIAKAIIHRIKSGYFGLKDEDGNTPLMVALLQKYEDLAWMIKKEMNCQQIRLPNRNKQIARNIAQQNGFIKMAEELKKEAGFFNSVYDDLFYG